MVRESYLEDVSMSKCPSVVFGCFHSAAKAVILKHDIKNKSVPFTDAKIKA